MANPSMDAQSLVRQHLETHPDVVREMLHTIAQTLMSAEADGACGAEYGERNPERVNSRNGYRLRDWDTRAGSIELAIPRLRQGSDSVSGAGQGSGGQTPPPTQGSSGTAPNSQDNPNMPSQPQTWTPK